MAPVWIRPASAASSDPPRRGTRSSASRTIATLPRPRSDPISAAVSTSSSAGLEQAEQRPPRIERGDHARGHAPPRRLRSPRRSLRRPSIVMRSTAAPVRITTPAARAAASSAAAKAPGPPAAWRGGASRCGTHAGRCQSRFQNDPAERGPMKLACSAGAASAALSASSRIARRARRARSSAADAARLRGRRGAARAKRRRRARRSEARSPSDALRARAQRRDQERRERLGQARAASAPTTRSAAASRAERRAMAASRSPDGSRCRLSPPPRSWSVPPRGSSKRSPWRSSSSSAAIDGMEALETGERRRRAKAGVDLVGRERAADALLASRAPPPRARRARAGWRPPGRCARRRPPRRRSARSCAIGQDARGGELARRSHHAAAGMSPRAAQVEPAHRRAIAAPTRHRSLEEELLEAQLAVEDVAFGEAEARARGPRASPPAGGGSSRAGWARTRRASRSRRRRRRRAASPSFPRRAGRGRTARRSTSRACPAAPASDRPASGSRCPCRDGARSGRTWRRRRRARGSRCRG